MRDISIDFARGFTVLFIPAIHCVLAYSRPEVYETWLGIPLAFIAEGPGGQLFMMLMGMGVVFKKVPVKSVLKKSGFLLLGGFGLNYLKFGILYNLDILPEGVVHDLQLGDGLNGLLDIFLIGDILHFAAIALLIISAIRRLNYYWYYAVVMALIIIFISPLCWDIFPGYPWRLIGGQPPLVFFPVFPWLVYPLIGLFVGHYWKKYPKGAADICGWLGVIMLVTGILWPFVFNESPSATFYRTYPGETIWHIGVVLLTLYAWKQLEKMLRAEVVISQLLCFCSRHISFIYCLQWILICWLLPLIGYQTLGVVESFIVSLYMTSIVIGVALLTFKNQ
jgi:hypothetical protein